MLKGDCRSTPGGAASTASGAIHSFCIKHFTHISPTKTTLQHDVAMRVRAKRGVAVVGPNYLQNPIWKPYLELIYLAHAALISALFGAYSGFVLAGGAK